VQFYHCGSALVLLLNSQVYRLTCFLKHIAEALNILVGHRLVIEEISALVDIL